MDARVAAPMLITMLLLGAGQGLPKTAGATAKTYTDSAHGISFQYPATWRAQLHVKDGGYAATLAKTYSILTDPDLGGALFVLVGDKKLMGRALEVAGLKLYKDGETMVGLIVIGHAVIGKHSFYSWSGKVKGSDGFVVLQTLYAGTGSAETYYLSTAILDHPAASAKTLRGILTSVSIR